MAFINSRTMAMTKKISKNRKPGGRMRVVPPSHGFKSLGLECLQEMRMDGTSSCLSKESGHKESIAAAEASSSATMKNDERLEINKECILSSVERIGTSVVIGMEFENGGSLKVEVEGDSIINIYSTNGSGYHPNPSLGTVSALLTEFIMDCKIIELKKDSTTVNGVTYDQQLVFTRDDGNHLTILLSPNTVKKIEYK
jgi:hypothetical protein